MQQPCITENNHGCLLSGYLPPDELSAPDQGVGSGKRKEAKAVKKGKDTCQEDCQQKKKVYTMIPG